MKATLKNYQQQPRKVRLIADLIRGKKVKKALSLLQFVDKKATVPFTKTLNSAVANAVSQGKKIDQLFVKTVTVDKGTMFKRYMPRARGSASAIHKRASHIAIELGEK